MASRRIDADRTTIGDEGWVLYVVRKEVHVAHGAIRTYGDYEVFIDGRRQSGLSGHMCECRGPGDNEHPGSAKRIRAGTYPLYTQNAHYRSVDYSVEPEEGAKPMPAVLVKGAGERTGILIHPAHPPNLFLSSVGCFNPTKDLTSSQRMDFFDSRKRVIALIESLKSFYPDVFDRRSSRRIRGATVVVAGEPTET